MIRCNGVAPLLILFISLAGCGGGDGFGPVPSDPEIRIDGRIVHESGALSAVIELEEPNGNPIRGAAVWLLDGKDRLALAEYPPASGDYRLAAGSIPLRSRYSVEVDAGSLGRVRSGAAPAPQPHEILLPEAFGVYDRNQGLEVAWSGWGSATAARIRLQENDVDRTGNDSGSWDVASGSLDTMTEWEYVIITRYADTPLSGAAPGSRLRVEVERVAGPFTIKD